MFISLNIFWSLILVFNQAHEKWLNRDDVSRLILSLKSVVPCVTYSLFNKRVFVIGPSTFFSVYYVRALLREKPCSVVLVDQLFLPVR